MGWLISVDDGADKILALGMGGGIVKLGHMKGYFLPYVGLVLLALAQMAHADPIGVKPGKVVLPLSGLEIELPKVAHKSWKLASSYNNEGASYDGRDVVDEWVGGKLVAGNWVMVGYFTAGDCRKALAEINMDDSWDADVKFAGRTWATRGGVYTFDASSDLGKAPSVAICGHRDADHKDVIIQHFYIGNRTIGRQAILAGLPKLTVVDRASRAWIADRWAPIVPLRQPEVRRRGKAGPTVFHLAFSHMDLTLPDDGYIWIHSKPQNGDSTDWLVRMAPALPGFQMEILRVRGSACVSVLNGITAPHRNVPGPRNLPPDWIAGPTLLVSGRTERTACHQAGSDAIIIGVFATPDNAPSATDFATFRPLLSSISAAADGK